MDTEPEPEPEPEPDLDSEPSPLAPHEILARQIEFFSTNPVGQMFGRAVEPESSGQDLTTTENHDMVLEDQTDPPTTES